MHSYPKLSKADYFSMLNAAFGMLSLLFSMKGDPWASGTFIMLSSLSDGIDGIIARKHGSSDVGKILDSLADLISFCIAPSALMLITFKLHLILFPFALILLLSSLTRLSSYPLKEHNEFFVGLPVPAAGLFITLMILLEFDRIYLMSASIILSSLMISTLHFPRLNKKLAIIASFLIVSTMVMRNSFHSLAPLAFLLSLLSYIIFGPIYLKIRKAL